MALTACVAAAEAEAGAPVEMRAGAQGPLPVSLARVNIPQFAELMNSLPVERYMRMRQDIEGYIELGNGMR